MNPPIRKLFDWRGIVALTVLLCIGYFVLSGIVGQREDAAKGRRIDTLIAQGKQDDADRTAAREAAAAQRDQLLANQAKLLRLYNQLGTRQARLVALLRSSGVELPPELADLAADAEPFTDPSEGGGSAGSPSTPTPATGSDKPGKGSTSTSPTTPAPSKPTTPPAPAPTPKGPIRGLVDGLVGLLPRKETAP